MALVPNSASAECPSDGLGACGKTQIAVMIAESLWRSGAIDMLIWITATSRASVLSAFVEASVAATGFEPIGTAESVVVRFISRLGETSQPWLVVLDDLQEVTYLDGLWPEGQAGRLLVTSTRPTIAVGRCGTQVIPVGFFSVREALNCLTEQLNAEPGPAFGRYRARRNARPRASGARPGFLGGRELDLGLPGLPGSFGPQAAADLG